MWGQRAICSLLLSTGVALTAVAEEPVAEAPAVSPAVAPPAQGDTVRMSNGDTTQVATPAAAQAAPDRLTPNVVNRIVAREKELDQLDAEIRALRAAIPLAAASQQAIAQARLTAKEDRYATLHLEQLVDSVIKFPIQVPFGLQRAVYESVQRARGNVGDAGVLVPSPSAPTVMELREVLENARDLPTAANHIRRITREMNEAQAKIEAELVGHKERMKQEVAALDAEEKSLQEQGLSARKIHEIIAGREAQMEANHRDTINRMKELNGEREMLRTMKTSATAFLITHSAEVPGGIALVLSGVGNLTAGNVQRGLIEIANGVAIASPAGLDYGCWGGQCIVWGPSRPFANGVREFVVAKGGALLEKLLFDTSKKKLSHDELIALLVKSNVAENISAMKVDGKKTEMTVLNPQGEKAASLTLEKGASGQYVLTDMTTHQKGLRTLDIDGTIKEMGGLGWDVQDAFRQLVIQSMDKETAEKYEAGRSSIVGRVVDPAIAAGDYIVEKGGKARAAVRGAMGMETPAEATSELPSFVKAGTGEMVDGVARFEITPGKVRMEAPRTLRPWVTKVAEYTAPARRLVGPAARDTLKAVGAGLEFSGQSVGTVLGDTIAAGIEGAKRTRELASAIAQGPVGQLCFRGFKALSLLNTKVEPSTYRQDQLVRFSRP